MPGGSAKSNFSIGEYLLEKVVVMSKQSNLMDDFRPIMPPLVRLLAGIIVLIVIQAAVLGFPGITQFIPTTTITIASMVIFTIGLVVAGSVLIFSQKRFSGRSLMREVAIAWLFLQMEQLFTSHPLRKNIGMSSMRATARC